MNPKSKAPTKTFAKKAAKNAAGPYKTSDTPFIPLGRGFIDYDEEVKKCTRFLLEFQDVRVSDKESLESFKYKSMMKNIEDRKTKKFDIELDDVFSYFSLKEIEIVERIERNTITYLRIFTKALDSLLKIPEISTHDPNQYLDSETVLDILVSQRIEKLKNDKQFQQQQQQQKNKKSFLSVNNNKNSDNIDSDNNNNDEKQDSNIGQYSTNDMKFDFPTEIIRRYELHILPRRDTVSLPIRKIKSEHIGALVTLTGIVTRVTDVKPMVTVALYTCDQCDAEIFQEITAREFMPIVMCTSKDCAQNSIGKSAGSLTIQTRGSKFIKFQEMKIQEIADQVPIGHTPRTTKVFVRGELTRMASPGDIVTLAGVFLPTPYTGHRAIRAGLLADTYIEAMKISQHKKTYEQLDLTEEMSQQVELEAQNEDIYEKLARSIAPEIYGHLDIKKSLLLMMIGGTSKQMKDGMSIRGDINICLMGDPGVAKSQLLKHICKIAPRGIYTSGKGSSGVGLTAAVIRDSVTGDFVLEGGSLVLADMGICCIDEFDKMEDADRTAIHEVMEQQTISIAKAGITTTLNARTSILAAANPAYGRYNFKKSPDENFNLPHSLLSRFDLLFLIIDRPNIENDRRLAQHVTHVHQKQQAPKEDSFEPFSSEFIRAYVSMARKYNPTVPRDLTEYIVEAYVTLRKLELQTKQPFTYTTARTLLGILRLAQAHARCRFATEISRLDVEEAMRLLHSSKASLIEERDKKKQTVDPLSSIYNIIRDYSNKYQTRSMEYQIIETKIITRGFTKIQIDQFFESYQNVVNLNESKTNINLL
ncbi:MCM family protein [Tieghemostelium lacteum]|uniref:DNA replication licensing factor MCM7 n=1 Tax=Tieghemostelium lacteum TaxID=361077 RepID=A0A151ZDA5_TIELA|nr:MCM family protein [Tieghemostelium lacteum]|eukprot:KYQ91933.1 MCM family protein [Tieghemostelium lacteum]